MIQKSDKSISTKLDGSNQKNRVRNDSTENQESSS